MLPPIEQCFEFANNRVKEVLRASRVAGHIFHFPQKSPLISTWEQLQDGWDSYLLWRCAS